ncbi:hypothetical protein LZ30DRAFT_130505 [Colletotrichum cereale]|nr:hypothetical protein LZ30DRAFT_130505 [Colletotrichum cereale]
MLLMNARNRSALPVALRHLYQPTSSLRGGGHARSSRPANHLLPTTTIRSREGVRRSAMHLPRPYRTAARAPRGCPPIRHRAMPRTNSSARSKHQRTKTHIHTQDPAALLRDARAQYAARSALDSESRVGAEAPGGVYQFIRMRRLAFFLTQIRRRRGRLVAFSRMCPISGRRRGPANFLLFSTFFSFLLRPVWSAPCRCTVCRRRETHRPTGAESRLAGLACMNPTVYMTWRRERKPASS